MGGDADGQVDLGLVEPEKQESRACIRRQNVVGVGVWAGF